jgi:hypothetical protein
VRGWGCGSAKRTRCTLYPSRSAEGGLNPAFRRSRAEQDCCRAENHGAGQAKATQSPPAHLLNIRERCAHRVRALLDIRERCAHRVRALLNIRERCAHHVRALLDIRERCAHRVRALLDIRERCAHRVRALLDICERCAHRVRALLDKRKHRRERERPRLDIPSARCHLLNPTEARDAGPWANTPRGPLLTVSGLTSGERACVLCPIFR